MSLSTTHPTFSQKVSKLAGIFSVVIFFCLLAVGEAAIPRFRHLLFQLPFFIAPALVSAWFQYRRIFHPARVPAPLATDSPTILQMKKIKRRLAWGTAVVFVATIAILFTTCDCEHHPVLTSFALLPPIVVYLGWVCLRQYIIERTKEISPAQVVGRGWPRRRLPASDYKPFYSDHWGENT